MRSVSRFLLAYLRPSSSRCVIRSVTWFRAMPVRMVRSAQPQRRTGWVSVLLLSATRCAGWRRSGARSGAHSGPGARGPGGGSAVEGAVGPGGSGTGWCAPEVLRRIRRASLAALRKEAEPVPAAALGRFLLVWQSIRGQGLRGVDGVLRAVEQLAGAPIPASGLERLVLPARVVDYAPPLLDELCA